MFWDERGTSAQSGLGTDTVSQDKTACHQVWTSAPTPPPPLGLSSLICKIIGLVLKVFLIQERKVALFQIWPAGGATSLSRAPTHGWIGRWIGL